VSREGPLLLSLILLPVFSSFLGFFPPPRSFKYLGFGELPPPSLFLFSRLSPSGFLFSKRPHSEFSPLIFLVGLSFFSQHTTPVVPKKTVILPFVSLRVDFFLKLFLTFFMFTSSFHSSPPDENPRLGRTPGDKEMTLLVPPAYPSVKSFLLCGFLAYV